MSNLYSIVTKSGPNINHLTNTEKFSVLYHNIFDYPLNFPELLKWNASKKKIAKNTELDVTGKNGYYYVEGREGLVYKRILRSRISQKKSAIAKKAAHLLSFLPTVKMIGVTGSLAMCNSSHQSDIDLIVITKQGTLWTTRILIHILLVISQIPFRRAGKKEEANKLCLNMWLDEGDLVWKKNDRNFYTAHEIAQIVPLVNKDKTYQRFMYKNKWILDFWPSAVKIARHKDIKRPSKKINLYIIEKLAYRLQKRYMKKKITREVITPTRALFHPNNWGKVVLERL